MQLHHYLRRVPVIKMLPTLACGIVVNSSLRFPGYVIGILLAFSTLLLFQRRYTGILITGCLLLTGMLRIQWVNDVTLPEFRQDVSYHLRGSVEGVKKGQYSTQFRIRPVPNANCGSILLRVKDPPDIQPGDRISFETALREPDPARNPGAFDYRSYLARQGIYLISDRYAKIDSVISGSWSPSRQLYHTRLLLEQKIEMFVDAPFAGMLKGLLLGLKSELDEEMRADFKSIGVIHILAVSGLHVGFILMILSATGKLIRLSDGWQVVFISAGLIFYMGLTGYPASVVRAGSMAILYVVGNYRERPGNPWNIIGITAFGILLWDPRQLYSVAFHLSFGAVAGILYFFPRLQELSAGSTMTFLSTNHRIIRPIRELVFLSIAAQLGTLVPMALVFHTFAVWGVLANLFIVPLAGISVITGFICLAAGFITPWLGSIYGEACWGLLWLMNQVSRGISMLPMKTILLGQFSFIEILLFLVMMVVLVIPSLLRKKQKFILLASVLIVVHTWIPIFTQDQVRFTFLDVGQGDACVIEDGEQTILIDAGYSGFGQDYGKSVILPYLQSRGLTSIDLLVMTHPHADHIGGIPTLLEQIPILNIWDTYNPYKSSLYSEILESAHDRAVPVHVPKVGGRYEFGKLILTVLYPDSTRSMQADNINNASIVLRVDHGRNRFLFMGDAEVPVEDFISPLVNELQSQIVKLGHHGSKTSSSNTLVSATGAEVGIISVGKGNKFNHPEPAVIRRWRENDTEIIRTDKCGAVVIISDGEGYQLDTRLTQE